MLKTLTLVLLALHLAGCATVAPPYKPATLGSLNDAESVAGIQMKITAERDQATIGDLVSFKVTIKNVSDKPVWFPKDYTLTMIWIYPDGKRDNWIREVQQPASIDAKSIRILQPGESFETQARVTTYFFDFEGITEFRAFMDLLPGRIVGTGPFWTGRLFSNGYGIHFKRATRG